MSEIRYIGLDFESSGSDPWGKHVPIQIGLALPNGEGFESLIGGWEFNGTQQDSPGRFGWSEEAFEVHKIHHSALTSAPPVWVVDIQAASWLIDQFGYTGRMLNVTVGWNVAGFDRQFVTRWMPNLNRLLSYRTVDLNSILFRLAGSSDKDFDKLKRNLKTDTSLAFLGEQQWHDALFDAKAALVSFNLLNPENMVETAILNAIQSVKS